MEVLAKLGIDWKLLLAQAVNFGILLFVLHRYAYKPMLRLLDERSQKIDRGLKDAEAAEAKLRAVGEEERKILGEAREESKRIIAATTESAKKRDELMLSDTKGKIDKMISEADVHLAEQQKKLIRDAKDEIASVVLLAVEKVLGEKLDGAGDRATIEKALNEIKPDKK